MMKKIIFILVLTCLVGMSSCDLASSYEKNVWYSNETLEQCLVSNLPEIISNDYYKKDNNSIYFNATNEEVRYYAKSVYEYLESKHFKYLGTRGEQKDSLAGVLASYYFRDVDSFGECYTQIYSKQYIFVYSNDNDDSDGIVFNEIIISSIDSKVLKYDRKDVYYDAEINLKYDQSYFLKESIIDFPVNEMILYTWFFHSCIVDGKEIVLYDKNENGIVTTEYSLIKFNVDYTGEFEFNELKYDFTWNVIDDTNVKVEFYDNSFGTITFKDDDIIVFNYNNMMFVYEDRV